MSILYIEIGNEENKVGGVCYKCTFVLWEIVGKHDICETTLCGLAVVPRSAVANFSSRNPSSLRLSERAKELLVRMRL